jgi:hypothetical protein
MTFSMPHASSRSALLSVKGQAIGASKVLSHGASLIVALFAPLAVRQYRRLNR